MALGRNPAQSRLVAWVRWLDKVLSRGFIFKGSQVLAVLAGVCVLLLAAITFVEVVGRNSPFAGACLAYNFESAEFLMAMVSVMALGYCWHAGGHIRMGLIRDNCGPRARAFIDAASSLFGIVFAAAVVWAVWGMSAQNQEFNAKTNDLQLPFAPMQITFTIVMAHFGLVLFRSWLGSTLTVFGLVAEKSETTANVPL